LVRKTTEAVKEVKKQQKMTMEHLSVAVNERDELSKDITLKMHATNKLKEKLQDFFRFE
jgi:uncharacterized coiled-coil DUF342 family protein